MAFKVIISKAAQKHINQSFEYYEDKQAHLGTRFYADFKNTITYLINDPYIFPVKSRTYREIKLSIFPYIIIYEIMDDVVIVLSVFNTSKNPTKKP